MINTLILNLKKKYLRKKNLHRLKKFPIFNQMSVCHLNRQYDTFSIIDGFFFRYHNVTVIKKYFMLF